MTPPPKKSVYLSCRRLFSGQYASLRKLKSIRKRLQENRNSIGVLAMQYQIDSIAAVVKVLLEGRVFESTSIAQRHFPELFEVSIDRASEKAASEAEAARSEVKAVEAEVVASGDEGNEEPENDAAVPDERPTAIPEDRPPHTTEKLSAGLIITRLGPATREIPTLYPTNFPYNVQHQIITTVQLILEQSCFDFGEAWLPGLMALHNWTCSEAVELTKWTKLMSRHESRIATTGVIQTDPEKPFKEALIATNKIRHSAVHRLHTSARGIEQMIADAVALTETLKDTERAGYLGAMGRKVALRIEEAEQNTTILENRLMEELADIAKRRAELDKLEELAISTMVNEDRDSKAAIGLALCEDFQMGKSKTPVFDSFGDPLDKANSLTNLPNGLESPSQGWEVHTLGEEEEEEEAQRGEEDGGDETDGSNPVGVTNLWFEQDSEVKGWEGGESRMSGGDDDVEAEKRDEEVFLDFE
ncbi:MAG: hypothetical protein M1839_004570 [Geoglossum umbratile]|nr:MAG: hypothetical protein M1839_004570 [Geoglossum umbratile]